MAGGGLSRLAIARLKRAGVPVASVLKHVGLTPEVIADQAHVLEVEVLDARQAILPVLGRANMRLLLIGTAMLIEVGFGHDTEGLRAHLVHLLASLIYLQA
jgi:hypothetical protein